MPFYKVSHKIFSHQFIVSNFDRILALVFSHISYFVILIPCPNKKCEKVTRICISLEEES